MRKTHFVFAVLLALSFLALPAPSSAQVAVGVSVRIGPPALPVYPQPVCPGPDYIWTPGYWAWGPDGYFWVPGTWVLAPEPGLLWTPGYWGWGGGVYAWHPGYWGPHVGFYGGINYGFGYFGVGFVGGEWRGRVFAYNTAVTNVNTTIVHNVYVNRTVINNVTINRTTVNNISYNGGPGGIAARPTHEEMMADRDRHFERTGEQDRHEMSARDNRDFLASVNHGRPSIAATSHPGQFNGNGVTAARTGYAPFHGPANATHGNGHSANAESFHGNDAYAARSGNINPPRGNGNGPSPRGDAAYARNNGSPHAYNADAPHNNPHSESKPRDDRGRGERSRDTEGGDRNR